MRDGNHTGRSLIEKYLMDGLERERFLAYKVCKKIEIMRNSKLFILSSVTINLPRRLVLINYEKQQKHNFFFLNKT